MIDTSFSIKHCHRDGLNWGDDSSSKWLAAGWTFIGSWICLPLSGLLQFMGAFHIQTLMVPCRVWTSWLLATYGLQWLLASYELHMVVCRIQTLWFLIAYLLQWLLAMYRLYMVSCHVQTSWLLSTYKLHDCLLYVDFNGCLPRTNLMVSYRERTSWLLAAYGLHDYLLVVYRLHDFLLRTNFMVSYHVWTSWLLACRIWTLWLLATYGLHGCFVLCCAVNWALSLHHLLIGWCWLFCWEATCDIQSQLMGDNVSSLFSFLGRW